MAFHGYPFSYHNDEHWIFRPVFTMVQNDSWDPQWYRYPPLTILLHRAILPGFLYFFPTNLIIPQMSWLNPEFILPHQFGALYVGRLMCSLFGALTVVVLYFSLRHFTNRTTAFSFSILYSFIYPSVFYSSFLRPEAPMIFFTFFAFFLLLQFYEKRKAYWVGLAGLAFGLAIGSKYNAAYFLPTGVLLLFLAKKSWSECFQSVLLFLICTSIGFVIANPFILLKYSEVVEQVQSEYYYYKHGGLYDTRSHWNNFIYYFRLLQSPYSVYYFLHLIFLLPVLTLVPSFDFSTKKKSVIWTSVFFVISYVILLCQFVIGVERNIVVLYPFIFLVLGIGFQHFYFDTPGKIKHFVGIAFVGFFIFSGYQIFLYQKTVNAPLPQDHVRTWISKNANEGSKIIKEFETPLIDPVKYKVIHTTRLSQINPYWIVQLNPDFLILSEYLHQKFLNFSDRYGRRIYQWMWKESPEFSDPNLAGIPLGIGMRVYNFQKLKAKFIEDFNDCMDPDSQCDHEQPTSQIPLNP